MKKNYLFIPEAKSWNSLIRKFLNLHKRIKKRNFSSEQQLINMSGKLQSIYKRLERMQYRVGIKLAGSALALMLISATSFSQDFTSLGNLTFTEDISVTNIPTPTYADIDGDSDLDMYVGYHSGYIQVFTNDGSGLFSAAGNLQADGSDIDIGNQSAPTFADIDGDSDLDLYVGDYNGNISVFINDGTGTYTATADLQADGTDIDIGYYSSPVFADIDDDGDLDLYVGDKYGYIRVYTNNGTGIFSEAGNLQADGTDINVGDYSAPVFEDIDNDSDLDLYIGNFYGVIQIFTNDGAGVFSAAGNLQADGSDINVGYNANPVFADIDGDSDLDLYVGENYGSIKVFTNDGTGSFYAAGNMQMVVGDIDVGEYSAPVFEDIDEDGDLDLYTGEFYGAIKVFTNNGNNSFSVAADLQADGVDINVGNFAAPVFANIDGDSDLDLYVGEGNGTVKVFTNDGTGTFSTAGNFQADGSDINVGWYSAPAFADIDGDSDLDLYVGELYGAIKVFTNDGTGTFNAAPDLQADGADIDVSYIPKPVFADIDGDSDLDLYVGEYYGYIQVFINDGTGIFSAAGNLQADGTDIFESWAAPAFANLDGCTINLFVGNEEGSIAVYEGTDIENPTITCLGNQEVDADDTNTYIVVGTEFDPTEVDDNCGVASVVNDFNSLETLDGAAIPEGTTTIVWTVFDDAGNEETCSFDILVNEYVSIDELSKSGISIYPNPSSGIFTIETSDAYNVAVIDITGKIVNEFIVNNTNETIDLRNQPNGVYFVKFNNDKTVKTVKIIIE